MRSEGEVEEFEKCQPRGALAKRGDVRLVEDGAERDDVRLIGGRLADRGEHLIVDRGVASLQGHAQDHEGGENRERHQAGDEAVFHRVDTGLVVQECFQHA